MSDLLGNRYYANFSERRLGEIHAIVKACIGPAQTPQETPKGSALP
jgi:hypothetical protein